MRNILMDKIKRSVLCMASMALMFFCLMLWMHSCRKADFLKWAENFKVMGYDELILTDTVWKKSKSPYRVTHSILIGEDVVLRIEPGVEVYLSSGVTLMCYGRILAQGKKDAPVFFKAASDQPWQRIECFGGMYQTTQDIPVNRFHYCVIEGGGGITFRSSAGEVMGCTFRNNVTCPLRLEFSSGRIIENEIYDNKTQEESASGNGAGIMVYSDKQVLVADNVVYRNASAGGRDGGGGIYAFAYDNGEVSVLRNTVYENTSDRNAGGIFAYACLVQDNRVHHNAASESGGGIYAVNATLVNNQIGRNQALRGGGVYADHCPLEHNLIHANIAKPGMGGQLYYFGSSRIVNNTLIHPVDISSTGEAMVVCGNPDIRGNNIISENGYGLRTENHYLSMDLHTLGNFWGTGDETAIHELIYDWLDDDRVGLVDWQVHSKNWIPTAPDAPDAWTPPAPPAPKQPHQIFGRIDRDITLGQPQGASYDVVGNVFIPEDVSMRLLAGTVLHIHPHATIRVRGKLLAQGNPEHFVRLTGDSHAPWGNLLFENRSVQTGSGHLPSGSEYLPLDENSLLSHCIIENGSGIVMEGAGARLEDCIVRRNSGSGIKIHDAGVTVTRCRITNNASPTHGGGIYTYGSKRVYIQANHIVNNTAGENGGGIFAYGEHANTAAHISGNHIEGNHAQSDGGGIWASRSSIINNHILSNTAAQNGGGIFSTFALVEHNHITGNASTCGGGVFAEKNSSFAGNIIEKNSADGPLAGGAYLNFWGMSVNNETFCRNTVKGNKARGKAAVGGIYLNGAMYFTQNNIIDNCGIQLYNANSTEIESFLAAGNFWGTSNKSKIEAFIFDWQDDARLSRVVFEPVAQKKINIKSP